MLCNSLAERKDTTLPRAILAGYIQWASLSIRLKRLTLSWTDLSNSHLIKIIPINVFQDSMISSHRGRCWYRLCFNIALVFIMRHRYPASHMIFTLAPFLQCYVTMDGTLDVCIASLKIASLLSTECLWLALGKIHCIYHLGIGLRTCTP